VTGALRTNDRPWWAAAYIADYIEETLNHVNKARERSSLSAGRPAWELDACADLFNALNKLWSTRAFHLGDQRHLDSSAANQLTALLKEPKESDGTTLLGMPSIEAFATFEPTILDHSVVGVTQRIADTPAETRRQAEADHRHFKEDWSRWRQRGSGVSRALASLSRAVLVVRNNLDHGEKTSVGPDHERIDRNRKVASVVLGVLEDLVDFIFEWPSQKLAVYGALSPGQPNHGMLRGLDGSWTPVRLNGVLDETGPPTFSFSTKGSAVEAELLTSADLAEHWARLDEFEGSAYMRQLGLVWRADSPRVANVYVASPNAGTPLTWSRVPR
jgi:gamma-glutamylcyclotransferase (GGCT)/AIG2-like uncharacterized protein YtfP